MMPEVAMSEWEYTIVVIRLRDDLEGFIDAKGREGWQYLHSWTDASTGRLLVHLRRPRHRGQLT